METDGKICFDTKLLRQGNNTGICVPDTCVQDLGAGRKPPVLVNINGFTYPSTIAVMAGKYMIPVSAAIRNKIGLQGGDPIHVELALDAEPRTVTLPADFAAALDRNEQAKSFFLKLSPSAQKKHLLLVTEAKTEETRKRRIEKAITEFLG